MAGGKGVAEIVTVGSKSSDQSASGLWPSLRSMEYVEDHQALFGNLVHDQIRQPWNDELAGILNASVPAPVRHGLQTLDRFVDAAGNPVRRLDATVLLDPVRDRLQVGHGLR